MSKRYNNGSHYENHQRAAELHDQAAHIHRMAAEQRGQQDHQTGHERSRQALEHSQRAYLHSQELHAHATGQPADVSLGDEEIAPLAYELWCARGCPAGSADEDWFNAEEQLRARHSTGNSQEPVEK
jgi:hypothetical protein